MLRQKPTQILSLKLLKKATIHFYYILKGLGKPVKHSVKYFIKMFDDV